MARNPLKVQHPNINVRLLRAVRNRIAKAPETFYMSDWITTIGRVRRLEKYRGMPRELRGIPDCGTVGCIAGEALLIRGYRQSEELLSLYADHPTTGARVSIAEEATNLLGLTPVQSSYLFTGAWTTRRVTARRAVQYLDKLLAGKDRTFPADGR